MREITGKNQFNNDITISLIGTFKIEALNKEFIIYSLTDAIDENPDGEIILGEIIRENNDIQVLGIEKEEQDLVQKYIINPKKGDAKYNKNKQSSMGGGTFKLVALLVLVVAFTAGVSYGIFSFDFDTVSNANAVAIVEDTAFPEITVDMVNNTTTVDKNDTANTDDSDVETTVTTIDTTTDTSDSSQGSDPTPAPTPSPSPEGGGSEGGSDGGGSADGGGSTD